MNHEGDHACVMQAGSGNGSPPSVRPWLGLAEDQPCLPQEQTLHPCCLPSQQTPHPSPVAQTALSRKFVQECENCQCIVTLQRSSAKSSSGIMKCDVLADINAERLQPQTAGPTIVCIISLTSQQAFPAPVQNPSVPTNVGYTNWPEAQRVCRYRQTHLIPLNVGEERLKGSAWQGPVKVRCVHHAQHDRPPVALQPNLAANLLSQVKLRQIRLCPRTLHLPVIESVLVMFSDIISCTLVGSKVNQSL
jgi:hypothetical protein